MQSQNWRYEMIKLVKKQLFDNNLHHKAKVYATRIKVTKNAKGKIVPYKRIMRLVNNLY
jgi:hypothetical protein